MVNLSFSTVNICRQHLKHVMQLCSLHKLTPNPVENYCNFSHWDSWLLLTRRYFSGIALVITLGAWFVGEGASNVTLASLAEVSVFVSVRRDHTVHLYIL